MEEQQKLPEPIKFTSYMTMREILCALLWLPIHVMVLPALAGKLLASGALTAGQANLFIYGVSTVYIVIAEYSFLRREFDPFCDRKLYCFFQILSSYLVMMAMDLFMSGIVSGVETLFGNGGEINNLNNDAILDLAGKEKNVVSAMVIFLAPIVEEVIFRGGFFCVLREKNRTAAYIVSILFFAVFHIWSYAMEDPAYWIYLLQYLPAGFLLCRCYERTNSLWCSIFFHMMTNSIALDALSALT